MNAFFRLLDMSLITMNRNILYQILLFFIIITVIFCNDINNYNHNIYAYSIYGNELQETNRLFNITSNKIDLTSYLH